MNGDQLDSLTERVLGAVFEVTNTLGAPDFSVKLKGEHLLRDSPVKTSAAVHPATCSTHAGPQIRSTAALNSRSGRTFAGTSSSTEKSRGAPSRSRTEVVPGLRLKSSSNAAARSTPPSRPIHTRMAITPGRSTRAL